MRGLNDCIIRLEPDNVRRVAASMQVKLSLVDYQCLKSFMPT